MGDIGLITKDDSCLLPDYLILDKYLLNTYLLNPMLDKYGIHPWIGLPILDKFSTVRVGAYAIRPTNVYDKGQMIRLPGTFGGVCHTPLHIRDKGLINTCLLNPFLGKDSIRHSTDLPVTTHLGGTGVGAYRIRPPDVTVGDEWSATPISTS